MLGRLAGRVVTGPVAFLVSGLIDLGVLMGYLLRTWTANRSHSRAGAAVLFCCVIGLGMSVSGALPSRASADSTEPSILMDDYAFIYSSPAQVEKNLQQVASLGVNTIKVSMVWSLVAPDPNSYTKPNFNATNPSDYPAGSWTRYDTLIEEAQALGLSVYFQLTAPAPLWATDPNGLGGHQHPFSHDPNAAEFEQFVQAVGERYSGSYPAPASSTAATTTAIGTATTSSGTVLSLLGDPVSMNGGTASGTLPAVHMWGIWNEPNEIGWLSPQYVERAGKLEPESPTMERGLINGAYQALIETGHAMDTILIGETASGGKITTIPFLRDLYCVGANDQPLTGTAATLINCPAAGNRQQFVVDNPGLFGATGWAHHPYSFNHAPNTPFKTAPTTITIANIGILERNLDRIDSTYGEPTGLPIYFTEWGYKTDPPNPFVRTSLGEQETWLDQGWYLSYMMPRIKAMAQELLYDQPPIAGKPPGTAAYWANFDSGLEFDNGAAKPAYDAFMLPIWLPSQHTGSRVTVWAELRPASVDNAPVALLEFEPTGSATWTSLTTLATTSPEGFILTHVAIPNRGRVRLAWTDPATSDVYYSRTVPVT